MKKYINKDWILNICFVVLVILIAIITRVYLYQVCVVSGSSMWPTYYNSDRVLVNKFDKNYKQNDVIVFEHGGYQYIKRIVGLPGDTVKITDGFVYINDEKYETLNSELVVWSGTASDGITLKDDEYFVLGDNYNDSKDSRDSEVGPVNKNLILGKVVRKLM